MEENKVLAMIAGREIKESDLDAFLSNVPEEHKGYVKNPKYREAYLEQLVALHLFAKLGEEMKLEETEEFKKIMESAKLDILAKVALSELVKDVEATQEEVEAYYKAHEEEYTEPETMRARHILVSDEDQCKRILGMIQSGEKTFEACAKEYSTCSSSQSGGDLGTFGKGEVVKEFEDAAFAAELGVVFGPVKTQFGYHIIRVEERYPSYVLPLIDVENEVKKKATKEKQENVYTAKLDELKEKYVEK